MSKQDSHSVLGVIRRALDAAGLDSSSRLVRGITGTIERAIGVERADAEESLPTAEPIALLERTPATDSFQPAATQADSAVVTKMRTDASGRFTSHVYSNRAGKRAYWLYRPAMRVAEPNLVVMLHGCTQGPEDFARGTRMNQLAEQHGFLVLYPEQTAKHNQMRCWNWFVPKDQRRDSGEPSILAGMAGAIASEHGISGQRVHVAGLSAGAAMAVILGRTYPDLFASVAAHSGLPFAAAHDVPSALAAMAGTPRSSNTALVSDAPLPESVRTIVFHGDADRTVSPVNSNSIVQDALRPFQRSMPLVESTEHEASRSRGGGTTTTTWRDPAGRPMVVSCRIENVGHAWAGGSQEGSFTDPDAPDASSRMWAFFQR